MDLVILQSPIREVSNSVLYIGLRYLSLSLNQLPILKYLEENLFKVLRFMMQNFEDDPTKRTIT